MQVINEYLTVETDENLISSLLNDALDISVKLKGRMSKKKIFILFKRSIFQWEFYTEKYYAKTEYKIN